MSPIAELRIGDACRPAFEARHGCASMVARPAKGVSISYWVNGWIKTYEHDTSDFKSYLKGSAQEYKKTEIKSASHRKYPNRCNYPQILPIYFLKSSLFMSETC